MMPRRWNLNCVNGMGGKERPRLQGWSPPARLARERLKRIRELEAEVRQLKRALRRTKA